MPDLTKIMLSPQQLIIVEDASWVLTKQEIIKKVYELFHSQIPVIGQLFMRHKDDWPAALLSAVPKISRGENYRNLPYAILDYPAVFDKENIFALRTMFWWGNFFSITLHLSGRFKELYQKGIMGNMAKNGEEDLYICVNNKAWEHHFEPVNYIPLYSLNPEELESHIQTKEFLKIALKINLNQWNKLEGLLPAAYNKVLQLLGS